MEITFLDISLTWKCEILSLSLAILISSLYVDFRRSLIALARILRVFLALIFLSVINNLHAEHHFSVPLRLSG